MNLIKDKWTKEDLKFFYEYLKDFSKGKESALWEKKIVNTNMKTLAVPSKVVNGIIKDIFKGDYLSFIDLWPWDNLTTTFIVGGLISKIKDFNIQKKYLLKYSQKADNWATIDTIKPKINENNRSAYIEFAKQCISSEYLFTRRLGLVLCLKCIDKNVIDDILFVACKLLNESEYYVNMANAWLIAECFIKCRDKTISCFDNKSFNKFVTNKAISKCRDSFRVSNSDKELLLKYKV